MRFRDMHVVATVDGPEGPIIVDCAVRKRDVEPDVLALLAEKAKGNLNGEASDPADVLVIGD